MSEASKAVVLDTLARAESVVISVHTRPDGDAIGSQLGLGLFLEKQGKTVLMLNADPHPYNLDWLPGSDRIVTYDGSLEQVKALAEADVIVVADTNAVHRIGDHGTLVKDGKATTLLVDHHPDPEGWFDLTWHRDSASSTGELVYEILSAWDADGMDNAICSSLYTAIMTDTGSFRYSNVTPDLHRKVADIIERGQLDVAHIHAEVYDKRSSGGIRLMGRILDTLDLRFDGQLGMMSVTRAALADTGASVEETEGIANQILSIEGVRVALLLTETERGTKISFRSKADDHVHGWARSFGGGGHRNAAGAFVHKSLEETVRQIVDTAPRYISFKEPDSSDSLSAEDEDYLSALLELKNKN
jgi:phosphoesterase RecJ-like protein